MRPQLLDIHAHGAVGTGFGATTEDSRRAVAFHAEQGIRIGAASLVSGTRERMVAEVRALAPLVADGTIGGIHLEGPFLAEACRGAHDPEVLRDPDPALIDELAGVLADAGAPGAIKHVTFAPEREGSEALIRCFAEHGIVPAIGHTAATGDEVTRTIALAHEVCGRPPLITHLFNGMPAFHHRSGGPAAAAISAGSRGEAFVEIIADGVHVAPEVVRMVFDSVDPEHIVLVSDAMAATGLGDGAYRLGSLDVQVVDGTARIRSADGSLGSIAGSTSTVADCVRWAIDVAGIPEEAVLRAATDNPARALGAA